jgi:hypothetical protein
VTSEQGLTAQVTPTSDTAGLYVANKSPRQIVVREINGGKGNGKFEFLVNGVRKGFEDKPVIVDKVSPSQDTDQDIQKEIENIAALAPKEAGDKPAPQINNELINKFLQNKMLEEKLALETEENPLPEGQEIADQQAKALDESGQPIQSDTTPKLNWWQKLVNFFKDLF